MKNEASPQIYTCPSCSSTNVRVVGKDNVVGRVIIQCDDCFYKGSIPMSSKVLVVLILLSIVCLVTNTVGLGPTLIYIFAIFGVATQINVYRHKVSPSTLRKNPEL